MDCQNSTNILPKELIEQIQKYVDGKVIYIPKKQINKKQWGEKHRYQASIGFTQLSDLFRPSKWNDNKTVIGKIFFDGEKHTKNT